MTFADLQPLEAVFVDADTFIYHFTNHPSVPRAVSRRRGWTVRTVCNGGPGKVGTP